VFDLLIREILICKFPNTNLKTTHKLKTELVCCRTQAKLIKSILPILTPEELNIYKKSRNVSASHNAPKPFSKTEYREATALESLLGYLYLKGDIKRLKELFRECLVQECGSVF
jgi:ribonuclease-3 family protein